MRILKKAFVAAALTAAALTPALAEPADRVIQMIDACRDDYQRYCPDVMPGGGRILSCLADADRDRLLAPVCKKAFTVAAAIHACTADYHRLCAHVPPGEDRAVACLGDQAQYVDEPCKTALVAALALKRGSHHDHDRPHEHSYRYKYEDEQLSHRERGYDGHRADGYDRHSYRAEPRDQDDEYIDEESEPRGLK
jgi:hypothetical protein